MARSVGHAALAGRIPLLCLTFALFVVYAGYALARQAGYLTAGYDLGIFDQAVRNYAHLRAPLVPLKGSDYNIFADHFHPIIATAAPFYWIWNSPDVLLVGQAALIAASVPFVHAFAARRMSDRAALVVAAGLRLRLGHPGDGGFRLSRDRIWRFRCWRRRSTRWIGDDDRVLLVAAGLLLLVREDMGVLLVMLGLLRLLRRRRPSRTGVLLIGAGVVGYLVVDLAGDTGLRAERPVRLLDLRRARPRSAARAGQHPGPPGTRRAAVPDPVGEGADPGLPARPVGVPAVAIEVLPDRAAAAGRTLLQLPRHGVDDPLPLQRAALAGAGAGHGGRRPNGWGSGPGAGCGRRCCATCWRCRSR